MLWTTTAGPSSRSLQPPWSFSHLVSRLRQSLTSISAVTAALPPRPPKGDLHIDSPVVRGCKFGVLWWHLHTQLHSQISTWDAQPLLRRTFGAFTSLLPATGICACGIACREQTAYSGHGHRVTTAASLWPRWRIKEIISLCGSELRQTLLLPINYQRREKYIKFCKKGY